MPRAVTNRGPGPERSRRLRAAQLVTAAALLLLAVVLLGCGGDDDESEGDGDETFAPNVVTADEIEAQEEGSPERALLEWWQSFQFGDASQVVALTSQETLDEVGEENLEDVVTNTGQGLQGIEVLGATEDGDTASIRVGLLQFTPEKEGEPPPDEPTSSTPDTFAMQNEGGEWLFAETAYLEPRIESFKQAQQQQEEGGEEQTTTTGEETTGE
jgi:hypothetical protein